MGKLPDNLISHLNCSFLIFFRFESQTFSENLIQFASIRLETILINTYIEKNVLTIYSYLIALEIDLPHIVRIPKQHLQRIMASSLL